MVPNVVSTTLIAGYLNLSFLSLHFTCLFCCQLFQKALPNLAASVAISRLAFCWMCNSPRTECAWKPTPIYMWREEAEIQWAPHVIFIVACCHSVKLCALACSGFPITTNWCFLLWPVCECGSRCNPHKRDMRSVHCIAIRRECCCNLSVDVALKVWFTTNGLCTKNNTQIYVTRTSNNRMISLNDLYCCLLPQWEALHTCRSSFLIQYKKYTSFPFACPIHQNDQIWPSTWIWIYILRHFNILMDLGVIIFA